MKIILSVLLSASMCFGQGTQLPGPVQVMPPKGGSPTGLIGIVPASQGFPCIELTGYYVFCGQNNEITVSTGDGRGFVSLKGKDGTNGTNGINGINGINGTNGKDGAPWTLNGKLFTIQCATGGQGVPHYFVKNCTITQQN